MEHKVLKISFPTVHSSDLGRWNNGTGYVGNVQELRLFPIGKNGDYFAVEKASICNAYFVMEDESIDEAIFD